MAFVHAHPDLRIGSTKSSDPLTLHSKRVQQPKRTFSPKDSQILNLSSASWTGSPQSSSALKVSQIGLDRATLTWPVAVLPKVQATTPIALPHLPPPADDNAGAEFFRRLRQLWVTHMLRLSAAMRGGAVRSAEDGVQPVFGGAGRGRGRLMFGLFGSRIPGLPKAGGALGRFRAGRKRRWNGSDGELGRQTTGAAGTLT